MTLDDLTPLLLRSHMTLPRIIVSKSYENTSMYVDTLINFATLTTYMYIYTHMNRMSGHIVSELSSCEKISSGKTKSNYHFIS